MRTFFLISSEDVGPNAGNHGHRIRYWLSPTPGRTNQGHQPLEDGWLGTTNDISRYALGRYSNREDAVEAMRKALPDGYILVQDDDDEAFTGRPKAPVADPLFTEGQIDACPFYAPLMRDLNSLYDSLGRPAEQYPDQPGTTTGGPYEMDDEIGDWGGEEAAILAAQQILITALGLSYPRAYTTPEWASFAAEAEEMLISYESALPSY